MHVAQQRCSSSSARGSYRCKQALATQVPQVHVAHRCQSVVACAQQTKSDVQEKISNLAGLGDTLGPIGLTYGGEVKPTRGQAGAEKPKPSLIGRGGVELGPIGLTIGGNGPSHADEDEGPSARPSSIHSMTTAEWRAMYEKEDGTVDLWLEDEFNAGSRLVGGRAVHRGGVYGFRTGEGPTAGDVPTHKVKIFDHYANQVIDVEVPEDRYILWEAEDKGLQLPYACRMGCCTACAVRIKEGEMYQPEALGISEELKQQGYALMCVGYPSSDLVIETVTEDEVYELQFGESFATGALDPNSPSVLRDDFALEIAQMDE